MRPFARWTTIHLLLLALTLATASQADQALFPGCSWFERYYPDLDASSLFCTPADSVINTATVWYQASWGHCTSVRAEIWINDHYVGDTGWVPPGGESAVYDVTAITQGADSVTVSLINPVCNAGEGCCPADGVIYVGWGGHMCLAGTLGGYPTGVADDLTARVNDSPRILLYPNPGGATFTIYWEASRPSGSVLQVFDVLGRLVRTLPLHRDGTASSGSVSWDGCDENATPVPSGIYMVLLSSASGRLAHRLVILR
jgi:hypothetical protein